MICERARQRIKEKEIRLEELREKRECVLLEICPGCGGDLEYMRDGDLCLLECGECGVRYVR